ncbi:GNAT family N-acetyltransferase [Lutimaribacter marinistellae]|uniref:GNAT family N-acetyltransferase n=1 Tax=Lutimaribacter marinistellae TaxID=1820329 RepID=A0ABV7TFD9_9RHOB
MDGAPLLTPPDADLGIRVARIDRFDAFQRLRDDWQALEARDPEGTVFLSWDWLAQGFRENPGQWMVIAIFAADRLIATFPLRTKVRWSKSRAEFQTELAAGGLFLWSEYTGFLCDPDWEDVAMTVFAEALQDLPWHDLTLRYEASARRADLFLRAFPEDTFRTGFRDYHINKGQTNNLLCPYVDLPDDYETWLGEGPGKNTRQKIRRFTRRYLDSGTLRVEQSKGAMLKSDLAATLKLWMRKWAPVKGPETAKRVAGNYMKILAAADRQGLLYLPVLRDGGRVIGGLGHILDPLHKRVHFILAGRDETVSGNHVGLLLHSQSIRWSIAQGYNVYDFCHGNEPYKYSFGSVDREVRYFSVRRRSGARHSMLDPLNNAQALARVLGFIENGRRQEAALGCRQVLGQLQAEL